MNIGNFNFTKFVAVILFAILAYVLYQYNKLEKEYIIKIHDLENYVNESVTILDKLDIPQVVESIIIYAGENKVCEYHNAKVIAHIKKAVHKGTSLTTYTYDVETDKEHVILTHSGENLVKITPMIEF